MQLSSILIGIIGGQEIILILIIVLVLFGGKKIPELMRGLGKGVNEYKKAKNEMMEDIGDPSKDQPSKTQNTESKEVH
jgi:sec-independent protein translocase protein TatA